MGMMTSSAAVESDAKLANPSLVEASSFISTIENMIDDGVRGRAVDAIRDRDDHNVRHGKNIGVEEFRQSNRETVDALIATAIAGDRKIETIKHYRTLTGASLIDAKNAVEDHLAKRPLIPQEVRDALVAEARTEASRKHLEYANKIRVQIHTGQLIEAIKTAREAYGMGLKEAKDYVEGLIAAGHEQYQNRPVHPQSEKSPVYLVIYRDDGDSNWNISHQFQKGWDVVDPKSEAFSYGKALLESWDQAKIVQVIAETKPVLQAL